MATNSNKDDGNMTVGSPDPGANPEPESDELNEEELDEASGGLLRYGNLTPVFSPQPPPIKPVLLPNPPLIKSVPTPPPI